MSNATRKFYFDTGVKPWNCNGLTKGQEWINGTKQIPFECDDLPEGCTFLHAGPENREPYKSNTKVFAVRKIKNSTLCSKYAFFRLPIKWESTKV